MCKKTVDESNFRSVQTMYLPIHILSVPLREFEVDCCFGCGATDRFWSVHSARAVSDGRWEMWKIWDKCIRNLLMSFTFAQFEHSTYLCTYGWLISTNLRLIISLLCCRIADLDLSSAKSVSTATNCHEKRRSPNCVRLLLNGNQSQWLLIFMFQKSSFLDIAVISFQLSALARQKLRCNCV